MTESGCGHTEKFNELTHEVLARGVCMRGGDVLLCRQKGSKRSFLPGGHIDPGEGARRALEREISEEIGLESTAGVFLGMAEHHFTNRDGTTWELNAVFALDVRGLPDSGDPASREPWQEFFWHPVGDLVSAGFEPADLGAVLPQWIATPGEAHFASRYEAEEKR